VDARSHARSLSPQEIDAFLAEVRLAHLATVDGRGLPRVRPVWFLWDDRVFWFTTRIRQRHTGRDWAEGGEVSVSVASDDQPYRAVIARGRPEVVGRDEGLLSAVSSRYLGGRGKLWTTEALRQPDRVVFRLEPATLISWDYGSLL
jgi:nitroimidazol reductase NimA-like FMN-containing flavoprotein (pyridoxamine 5'-phosphate oxidase superfamily)